MTKDTLTCLLKLPDCGRTSGNPVCPKCGLDETLRYTTQEAMLLAQSQAQAKYWQTHAQGLQAQLKQAIEPPASPPPPKRAYKVGEVFQDLPMSPPMVGLPTGSFLMGSEPTGWFSKMASDEMPKHKVSIGYSLAMGRYPVTFEEWDACVADGGVDHKPKDKGWGRGKRPVIGVSWNDAQAYIAWLNKKQGIEAKDPTRYRLPSEAEWEYACRAGGEGKWCFGDDESQLKQHAWYSANSGNQTHPVGQKKANAFGLCDMHGNVREWAQDRWHGNYEGAPTDGSAWTSGGDESRRVLCGGSWGGIPSFLHSARRDQNSPDYRNNDVGFRLARTVP